MRPTDRGHHPNHPPLPGVARGRGHVFAALLVVFTGCDRSPDPGPPPGATLRDSAGVEIVESTERLWGDAEGWRVDSIPALDLAETGDGPPHQFVNVRDMRRLPDGRIVVVDEGVDEVRVYSASGAFVQGIGRTGEGPGEFSRPISAEPFRGDSVAIWDFWLRRLTVVDSALELGRVSRLPDPDLRSQRIHWLGDSTFVGSIYTYDAVGEVQPGYYRMPVQIARFSFSEPTWDTLASIGGFEGYVLSGGDAAPPFAKRSHVAASRGRVVAGSADRMEMLEFVARGALERIIRVPAYDLSITEADVESEISPWTSPEAPPPLRAAVRDMPIPETKPAYSRLILDSMGYLWARRYQLRGEVGGPHDWEVFDPSGVWLGSVRTPARFTVLSIEDDHLLGVFEDDLDVQHPQRLPLRR